MFGIIFGDLAAESAKRPGGIQEERMDWHYPLHCIYEVSRPDLRDQVHADGFGTHRAFRSLSDYFLASEKTSSNFFSFGTITALQ